MGASDLSGHVAQPAGKVDLCDARRKVGAEVATLPQLQAPSWPPALDGIRLTTAVGRDVSSATCSDTLSYVGY